MNRKIQYNLQRAIRKGMLYYAARTLLGWTATQAGAFSRGQSLESFKRQHQKSNNKWRRQVYRAYRESGLSSTEAKAALNGITVEAQRARDAAVMRRRFQRLRAQGYSYYEAYAKIQGCSAAQARAKGRAYCRAYREKYGSAIGHVGSDDWIRREQEKLAVKLGIEEG